MDASRYATVAIAGLLVTSIAAAAPAPGPARSPFRLGTDVRPVSEDVRLTIDPAQADYSGHVAIALDVKKATRAIKLHAEDMTLGTIELVRTLDGARPIPLVPTSGEHGLLTLTAAKPVPVGLYRLTIAFTNDFNRQATSLYRLQSGGDWYAFTQFEADDAREAFPCFDEPEFKIPWTVTVIAPAAHLVIGNTPIAQETTAEGWKTVTFAPTKPMPSYLIAIASGPLETVPITGMSVPGRVVTVKGASALAQEAARITPPLVAALESYFGRPYPYEKLDLLALPEFWPGAMENAGAITFADRLLLLDPAHASASQRRNQASVTAHELAHMWFGDLVTMEWWDDLWLNESFASWMGEKITHEVFPEFGIDLNEVGDADEAMRTDGTLSTRAIRQPVNSLANLLQSADVLAYKKGQTVLGMFEQWAGEEKFRTGVRNYLAAHAWGNATAADLWSALSQASGKDLSGPMASFLDQPGVPILSVEPLGGGKVRLSQERFLPAGAAKQKPQVWQVPIVLKYGDGSATRTRNVLLAQPSEVVDLEGAHIDWIAPNATAWGYYRWRVQEPALMTLADRAELVLTPRERMEFVYNARALLDAGILHADAYLDVLPHPLRDSEPSVVGAALDGLEGVRDPLVPPTLDEPFARYVRSALGPPLAHFGRARAPGEKETVSFLRPRLLMLMADYGQDKATRAYADSLSRAYLADPGSIDPSLAPPVLAIASYRNDPGMHAEMRKRFESAQAPSERRIYLNAMTAFRDPKLVADNLNYSLAGPLKPQEIFAVLRGVEEYPPNRDQAWAWLQANYAPVMKRIPPMMGAFMPAFAGGCSEERIGQAREYFAEPEHAPPGAEKELAKVSERVENCLDLREREGERVRAYLTKPAGMN